MTTSHVTLPKTPPVAVIEAMIEASLANQNNVEIIYKAIIDHFEYEVMRETVGASDTQILRVEVGTGTNCESHTPFVTLSAFIGPEQKRAIGYMSPEQALRLATDVANMSVKAKGAL